MKILIVDDDDSVRFALVELLKSVGYNVTDSPSAEDGISKLENETIDIAIVDYHLPGINGLDLLSVIKENFNWVQVIFITAYGSENLAIKAIKQGAYDYVAKPFNNVELLNRINHIRDNLNKNVIEGNSKFGYYFSPSMKAIIEKMKTVAITDIPVLITGESGTGKELIARLCHYYSKREGNFISVNSSALPSSLIESELFGSEKGAFTGADKRKIGLFELASEGTIFLDEIGEMPVDMQVKLLRVLQEGEIQRIGNGIPVKINSRVIAATNRNIEEEIKNNNFREDLFYRLNVVQLKIPPLRSRKDEIKPLALTFVNEFNEKYKKVIIGFKPDTLEKMLNYSWPGNIRELRNKIEKAVVLCNSEWINSKLLSLHDNTIETNNNSDYLEDSNNINHQRNQLKKDTDLEINFNELPENLVQAKKQIIEKFEKKYILFYLNRNNWNVKKTSEILGLCRQDLYKKMKKVGIQKKVEYS